MMAFIFITNEDNKTLPLALYGLHSSLRYTGDWVSIFTAALIVIIPTIALYVILSGKLISGITMGALK